MGVGREVITLLVSLLEENNGMKHMFGLLRLILMAFLVSTEKSPKSSNILLIGENNHGWHPGKEAFYPVGEETGLEDTLFLCPDALRFSHR